MIGRGLLAVALLSNCVLSLPVTGSHLENEDVQVMKCIVEALADVLSRTRPLTVSQECLVTLKTDGRLVSILRHHNFLRELQEIALEGDKERAQQRTNPMTQIPLTTSDVPDRSMLEALGSPGERSILSEKRRTGTGDREEEKPGSFAAGESQEDEGIAEGRQAERESEERPERRSSSSVDESSEAERREEEEEDEEKGANSEEASKENITKDKADQKTPVAGSAEKRHVTRNKSKGKKPKEEEEKDKRSALFSHKQEEKPESDEEDEEETKRGGPERSLWTKRGKALQVKKKAAQQQSSQQEVPHHSKEVSEEEEEEKEEVEEKKKRDSHKSPEEKELQMIARKAPEEKRGSEEEGSAGRKSEEQEIESLAAIESELENVAQKLHDLRRG